MKSFQSNLAFASPGLAIATVTSGVRIAAVTPYCVDSVFGSKAITDNIPFVVSVPVGVWSAPGDGSFTGRVGGSTRLYGVFLDAAGNVSFNAGDIVNSAQLAGGAVCLPYPAPSDGRVLIGCVRIAVTANTTFVPNVTLLGAVGVTASFINLAGSVPTAPLRA